MEIILRFKNLTMHLKFFLKTHGVFYIEYLLAKALTFIYLANRLKCIIISNSMSLDSLQLPVISPVNSWEFSEFDSILNAQKK